MVLAFLTAFLVAYTGVGPSGTVSTGDLVKSICTEKNVDACVKPLVEATMETKNEK